MTSPVMMWSPELGNAQAELYPIMALYCFTLDPGLVGGTSQQSTLLLRA